jgi:thiamine biosynthesis lipoprotein
MNFFKIVIPFSILLVNNRQDYVLKSSEKVHSNVEGDKIYQQQYVLRGRAQGTTYSIQYVHNDSIIKKTSVDSIFKVIDLSLSLYSPNSLINQFNANGNVKMDVHLRRVIEKSLEVYKISTGAFDITVKPLVDLWGFGVKKKDVMIPTQKEILQTLKIVGSDKLNIHNDTLRALKKGVQIDCNGIAQGYTVDVLSDYLKSKGVFNYLVEVGGEIIAFGKNISNEDWKVGVESAETIAGDWHPLQNVIALNNEAITTSGVYRNYFTYKGHNYSHIINPKTGFPVLNEIVSVAVVAEDAITADAWDNALMVMGLSAIKKNKWLVKNCILLTTQNNVKAISVKATIKIR